VEGDVVLVAVAVEITPLIARNGHMILLVAVVSVPP
jgi:hypothetical protein